ncbi:hypothetical protein Mapa_009569 [Marchantia paleacea]|nr:hypothetical protein Mapa_009569 [Marchantia paleacea]
MSGLESNRMDRSSEQLPSSLGRGPIKLLKARSSSCRFASFPKLVEISPERLKSCPLRLIDRTDNPSSRHEIPDQLQGDASVASQLFILPGVSTKELLISSRI